MIDANIIYKQIETTVLNSLKKMMNNYFNTYGNPENQDIPSKLNDVTISEIKSIVEDIFTQLKLELVTDLTTAMNAAVPMDGGKTALTILIGLINSWNTTITEE